LLSLVSRSLSLGDAKPATTQEKLQLKRAITSTDAAIDLLVYELFGLTDEEIGIVEST
jgi:type II restriction/modification system DNA methylase subunit YeeA